MLPSTVWRAGSGDAECHANYHREFDGTAQSAAKKGATLAPWIKTWFDTNIDKVGHNPQRNGRR